MKKKPAEQKTKNKHWKAKENKNPEQAQQKAFKYHNTFNIIKTEIVPAWLALQGKLNILKSRK